MVVKGWLNIENGSERHRVILAKKVNSARNEEKVSVSCKIIN
jgi:hypothetical protein